MESCRDSFACDQRDDADYDDDNEKGLSSPALSMMMPAEKAMKVLKANADTPAPRKRRRSSGTSSSSSSRVVIRLLRPSDQTA